MMSERRARMDEAARWQRKADDAGRLHLIETNPRRRDLLANAEIEWGERARELRGLSRQEKRVVGTGSLCTLASVLFLGPGALIGGTELSPELALVGIFGPLAIAALWWNVIIPPRMVREADTRTTWRPVPERAGEEASVR